ncbi:MAG: hypothetical protein RLZZ253_3360, partial [Verrucomicrobiota bacterium]
FVPELRVLVQGARQPFLRGTAKTGGSLLGEDDAEGDSVPERDPPCPSMFQVMDGDLALGRLAPDSMEMGKVGDIAAWAKVRGNREGPCAEPAATAGVDHQVGLFSAPVFDACEGVVGEQEPVVFSVPDSRARC